MTSKNINKKKMVIVGAEPVRNVDTFFYLKEKKETKKQIRYIFDTITCGSVNSYSYLNWEDEDIYKGFQAIYKWTKQEVRDALMELIREEGE